VTLEGAAGLLWILKGDMLKPCPQSIEGYVPEASVLDVQYHPGIMKVHRRDNISRPTAILPRVGS
jgi:hypothetical protein